MPPESVQGSPWLGENRAASGGIPQTTGGDDALQTVSDDAMQRRMAGMQAPEKVVSYLLAIGVEGRCGSCRRSAGPRGALAAPSDRQLLAVARRDARQLPRITGEVR
jgi:hypothetical protein